MATTTSANIFELFLGRALAWCVHPFVAWRVKPRHVRAAIVGGYIAAGYLAGGICLFLFK